MARVSVFRTAILPHEGDNVAVNHRYAERLLKFCSGRRAATASPSPATRASPITCAASTRPTAPRAFDHEFMGERVYGRPMTIESVPVRRLPRRTRTAAPLGRHLDGCRIGFDLGASDRKCAAVVDGKVVFSEEVAWNPSVQSDPQYHFDGIHDSLQRAAAHLPRVDAIGGSAAGVYVNNEVRVGSLYRAVPQDLFDTPRTPPVLRPAKRLGRHSLRRGERWRSDRARRLHGAQR